MNWAMGVDDLHWAHMSVPTTPNALATPLLHPTRVLGDDLCRRFRHEWVLTNGLGGFAMGTVGGVPERRYHGWLVAAMSPPIGRVCTLQSCAEWLVIEKAGGGLTRYDLTSFRFGPVASPTLSPAGSKSLRAFQILHSAAWTYGVRIDGDARYEVEVTRELVLFADRNAVGLRYRVSGDLPEGARAWLEVRPLLAMRDFHQLCAASVPAGDPRTILMATGGMGNGLTGGSASESRPRGFSASNNAAMLHMAVKGAEGRFSSSVEAWRGFFYQRDFDRADVGVARNAEEEKSLRAAQASEDLFSPGAFSVPLHALSAAAEDAPLGGMRVGLATKKTAMVEIAAWVGQVTEEPGSVEEELLKRARHAERLATQAIARAHDAAKYETTNAGPHSKPGTEASIATLFDDRAVASLALASDQFVVRRGGIVGAGEGVATGSGSLRSVIAGYPWFSDWGRDTTISLPGLFLVTGRFEEARDTLRAFAAMRKNGLIPNCFDDGAGTALYNTVDASLWFLHAACQYRLRTGDAEGFGLLRAACLEIVDAYRKGTDYGIKVDASDGLVAAGNPSVQLTWMDAKRDGVVFTPRHGKAVEINALWYSGLKQLADAVEGDAPRTARELRQIAEQCGASFEKKFWNEREQCLFDVLTPDERGGFAPSAEVRCNQVFAASLPVSPLPLEKRRAVMNAVRRRLVTPVGLRTLDPRDPQYRARFEGTIFERDRAYHNGTVWPWLLGSYAEAVLRCGQFSPQSRAEARSVLLPLIAELTGSTRAGGAEVCETGSVNSLVEVYDADEPRRPDGCMAQAWSVAETLRVYVMALRGG